MLMLDLAKVAPSFDQAPAGLRLILAAVRDDGCAVSFAVRQAKAAFDVARGRPTIVMIDDTNGAEGPMGFHAKSLRRVARRCTTALIATPQPDVGLVQLLLRQASEKREDVLHIETDAEQANAWVDYLLAQRPDMAFVTAMRRSAIGTGTRH